jgi:ubiquinone/menaquinone biosynthesis C-methylase UbiE
MAFWIIPVTLSVLFLIGMSILPLRISRDISQEKADDYKSIIAYNRISRGPLFAIMRFYIMRQIAKLKPNGILVDAGCGPGHLISAIARKFPHVNIIGIDISPEMLNMAVNNLTLSPQKTQVHFQVADVQHLPLTDNCLDLVVSTLSLHHWPNPEQALNEIYRVIKPGGQLLIFDLRRDISQMLFNLIRFVQCLLAPSPIRRTNGGIGSVWSSLTEAEMEMVLKKVPFSDQKVLKRWGWCYMKGRK